jgi:hypothetical protein
MDSVLEVLSPDTLEIVEEIHYGLDVGEQGPPGIPGPQGNPGTQGIPGPSGIPGVGVPPGGTAGQALQKLDSTDYNTAWVTPAPGGLTSFNGRTTAAAVLTTADVAAVLPAVGTPGTYGDATHYPVVTTDAQGRVSTVTLQTVSSGGLTSFNGRATAAAVLTSVDVTGALGFSDFARLGQANIYTAAQTIRGGAGPALDLDVNNATGLHWLDFTSASGVNAYGSFRISVTNGNVELTSAGHNFLLSPLTTGSGGVVISSSDVAPQAKLDVRAISSQNALCLDIGNTIGPKWIEFTSAARANTYGSISIDASALSFSGTFNVQFLPGSGYGCAFGFNNGGGTLPAMLNVQPGTAAQHVAILRGKPSQAGDMLEVQDSTNAILSRFNKDGYLMTRKKAAPADADLVASELSLWLTDTPGAAVVNFKAKDSGGVVRTGSVPLSAAAAAFTALSALKWGSL